MKKNLTEIVFILDRSGSMNGLEKDTIGGYNSFLEKQSKLEGDAYTSEAGGGHAAVYYVPDAVSGSYLYCVPGSDLTESGTYSTAAVRPVGYYTDIHGAERVKTGMPWQSMAASLAELLTASDAGNTVRVEAQYTGGGYTAYQWFDMTVVRTPTLSALEVTVQGVAQSIGFAPERQRDLKSVFRPMAARAATIRNLLMVFNAAAVPAGIRPKEVSADMARKPKINHGKMDLMLTFTAVPSAACAFRFRCTLMAANARTAGMMERVRVSFTMVAKSPAASLNA